MEIPSSAYPAIGAISAATIAGSISFVSTVLSKDQKTSEFRQAWIDALREELSEFLSHINTISSFLRVKRNRGGSVESLLNYLEEKDEEVRQAEMMYSRIRFRLNPKEHQKLLQYLTDTHVLLTSSKIFEKDHVNSLSEAFTAESQRVLKNEWRRVKRGELAFILTKYASLVIFLGALVAAGYFGKPYFASALAP